MERELTLRIILEKPPAGVDFGVQKGRGSDYDIIQKQTSTTKDLHFEFTVGVKAGKDAAPVFIGPLVQGPPADRFVYIDIGTYGGQADTPWSRRLKIPLRSITWDMINSRAALEARAWRRKGRRAHLRNGETLLRLEMIPQPSNRFPSGPQPS